MLALMISALSLTKLLHSLLVYKCGGVVHSPFVHFLSTPDAVAIDSKPALEPSAESAPIGEPKVCTLSSVPTCLLNTHLFVQLLGVLRGGGYLCTK